MTFKQTPGGSERVSPGTAERRSTGSGLGRKHRVCRALLGMLVEQLGGKVAGVE